MRPGAVETSVVGFLAALLGAIVPRMRTSYAIQTLSLTLAFTACSSDVPSAGADPEKQLAALEARFLDGFNSGDAGALSALFAADGVRVISGAQLPSVGQEAIKALFEADIAQHNANLDNQLSSKMRAVRALGDGILLADGAFDLKDKDGALLLGGKWGCVYRETGEGLEVVMESAHVAKDTLKEQIDFSKVKRQAAPAADFGDAAKYLKAIERQIADYQAAIKAGDAAKIAGLFVEDGIQLVSSSSKPHVGRAGIEAALKPILSEGGYTGTNLDVTTLGIRELSSKLLCAHGIWQISADDGSTLEFGQWGNLLEIQADGSLKLIMESTGALHVAE